MTATDSATKAAAPVATTTLESVSETRAHASISRGRSIAVVSGIFLAILMGALDQYVVLTALPNIALDLGQPGGVAFVISAYLISGTVGIPIFGRLADTYSRRNIFLVGLATFIAGSVLAGLSQNFAELIAFRAIQGFSSGAFIVVGFTIVSVLFPPEARTRIAGLFTGTFVIATILGPLLGSYIVDETTWRWVFFINVPIAVVGVLTLVPALGKLVPEKRGRLDVPGIALLFGWVSPLMFALVQNSDSGWAWTDTRVIGLLAVSAILLVAFVVRELRTRDPLLPLRFFARRIFAASGSVSFFRGVVLSSQLAFISIYVGVLLLHGGPSASDTVRDVLYWLLIPAVIGAALGSQLLTRMGYRPLTAFGMGLALIGTLLLTQISPSTPTWQFSYGLLPTGGLILALPPIGLGIGLTFPVTLLSAQFAVSKDDVGSATAVIQFLGVLGGALGVSLLSSFQQWRVAALSPYPAPPGCAPGQALTAICSGYLRAVQNAGVASIQEVFTVTLALIGIGFISTLFMKGRIPKNAKLTEM